MTPLQKSARRVRDMLLALPLEKGMERTPGFVAVRKYLGSLYEEYGQSAVKRELAKLGMTHSGRIQ